MTSRLHRRTAALSALLLAAVPTAGRAQSAFVPQTTSGGTIRLWGDTYMSSVVAAWEQRFQRYHPDVHFETRLMGTDTAMPGLYNGLADIALFGRESNQTENDGFLHTLQYPALRLHLMTGSLDVADKSYAPVLYVAKVNPLQKLTLAQADAIFGCGQPGLGTPASTWGDIGLSGSWKTRTIHVYTFDLESGTGIFLLHRLQGESKKMNWKIVREYRDIQRPDGSTYAAGQQTMDALRRDPGGIAVSGIQYAEDDVKPLALAADSTSPYVFATPGTLIDGTYPLTRMTYAFVNQAPGQPIPPLVKEFLRFVYSEEGQSLIAHEGFLPLAKPDAANQLRLLH